MNESAQADEMFRNVYEALRRLAAAKLTNEPAGHTLNATALVHEAYLKLAPRKDLKDSVQFFRAAAVAMQRILVDHARRKRAEKRGGKGQRFTLVDGDRAIEYDSENLLDLDDALTRLAAEDATSAEVARLRLFAGLSVDQAADALAISRATGFREWAYARSWLSVALTREEPTDSDPS
jgi:RNA polymerase sigma factor (TIGR02999 family)